MDFDVSRIRAYFPPQNRPISRLYVAVPNYTRRPCTERSQIPHIYVRINVCGGRHVFIIYNSARSSKIYTLIRKFQRARIARKLLLFYPCGNTAAQVESALPPLSAVESRGNYIGSRRILLPKCCIARPMYLSISRSLRSIRLHLQLRPGSVTVVTSDQRTRGYRRHRR